MRRPDSQLAFAAGDSPLGRILVITEQQELRRITFAVTPGEHASLAGQELADPRQAQAWLSVLQAYLNDPQSLPTRPPLPPGTAFQRAVWNELLKLLPGQTLSYSELAGRLQRPQASRAVAKACASNPIAILIPCHRILRRDGGLGGYRWGEERKRWLLRHEGARTCS